MNRASLVFGLAAAALWLAGGTIAAGPSDPAAAKPQVDLSVPPSPPISLHVERPPMDDDAPTATKPKPISGSSDVTAEAEAAESPSLGASDTEPAPSTGR